MEHDSIGAFDPNLPDAGRKDLADDAVGGEVRRGVARRREDSRLAVVTIHIGNA
jgi:hypothetical protein